MAKTWEQQNTAWEAWTLPWGSAETDGVVAVTPLNGSFETRTDLTGSVDEQVALNGSVA